ncbi:DUF1214 domain-containing protein [Mycobacterium sp. ITM-2016-00318]|uniref:DUF1214 domain-containing protein n=1 Tax=Mycobacterium sp. ITM-2016-00318 TaxID=2099693 RepID=UPI00287F6B6D|nr:DUF1214 domain-containing protein [Mycobacterium sp. ITM-2016-00318]WNG94452.1 DUF1214 domain-containing protein [Mycobacterium sp. ITM-2016-00318]
MAKTPCSHSIDTHYGRFIGRVGGLAVALGIGVAIANNPGIASASDGQDAGSENTSATSESSGAPSSKKADPVIKQIHSQLNDVRDRVESTRSEVRSAIRDARKTTRLALKANAGTNSAVAQTIKSTPKAPKPAPNPALVAVAGFVRRELEQAVTPARAPESSTSAAAVAESVTTQAVSPLGTPEQRDAEQTATETVNTLPVQLTKLVLKTGWYVTALGEYSEVGGPDEDNLGQLSRAVDEYAMGAAFQQQILNPMTPRAVMQVAPPHTWYGQMVGGSRILYDNPDTIYRFMPVNKTSTYVIRGRFENWDATQGFNGTNQPTDTTFSLLTGLSGNTAAVIGQDKLKVDENGEFEILVSGDPPPAGYQGNYLQLTSDSTLIAARDTLADWNDEQPMSLSIERISGPPNSFLAQMGIFTIPLIGPAVTDSPLLTQLVSIVPPLPELPIVRGAVTSVIMLLGLQMERDYIRVATVDPATGEQREPNVVPQPTSNAAFLSTQLQSAGYFQLEDNQSLVVTIDPGDSGYFVVPVTNDWTITDNYWDQPSSLNNEQAHRNADGTYTFVISPTDSNTKNWVSTGGLNQGTFSIRFQDLGTTAPRIVSYEVVDNDQLSSKLPADAFIPAGDPYRQDQIADRQAGFNNRFAPFVQT